MLRDFMQNPVFQNLAIIILSAKFIGGLTAAAVFFWQSIRGRVSLHELRRWRCP